MRLLRRLPLVVRTTAALASRRFGHGLEHLLGEVLRHEVDHPPPEHHVVPVRQRESLLHDQVERRPEHRSVCGLHPTTLRVAVSRDEDQEAVGLRHILARQRVDPVTTHVRETDERHTRLRVGRTEVLVQRVRLAAPADLRERQEPRGVLTQCIQLHIPVRPARQPLHLSRRPSLRSDRGLERPGELESDLAVEQAEQPGVLADDDHQLGDSLAEPVALARASLVKRGDCLELVLPADHAARLELLRVLVGLEDPREVLLAPRLGFRLVALSARCLLPLLFLAPLHRRPSLLLTDLLATRPLGALQQLHVGEGDREQQHVPHAVDLLAGHQVQVHEPVSAGEFQRRVQRVILLRDHLAPLRDDGVRVESSQRLRADAGDSGSELDHELGELVAVALDPHLVRDLEPDPLSAVSEETEDSGDRRVHHGPSVLVIGPLLVPNQVADLGGFGSRDRRDFLGLLGSVRSGQRLHLGRDRQRFRAGLGSRVHGFRRDLRGLRLGLGLLAGHLGLLHLRLLVGGGLTDHDPVAPAEEGHARSLAGGLADPLDHERELHHERQENGAHDGDLEPVSLLDLDGVLLERHLDHLGDRVGAGLHEGVGLDALHEARGLVVVHPDLDGALPAPRLLLALRLALRLGLVPGRLHGGGALGRLVPVLHEGDAGLLASLRARFGLLGLDLLDFRRLHDHLIRIRGLQEALQDGVVCQGAELVLLCCVLRHLLLSISGFARFGPTGPGGMVPSATSEVLCLSMSDNDVQNTTGLKPHSSRIVLYRPYKMTGH